MVVNELFINYIKYNKISPQQKLFLSPYDRYATPGTHPAPTSTGST